MIPPLSAMMEKAATAPFAGLDSIVGAGGLLVLAPHPDDESLGCGALLRAAARSGRRVSVVLVTDGRLSHPSSPTVNGEALARLRSMEIRAALRALHPAISLIELGYRDCDVPTALSASYFAARKIAGALDDIDATALVTSWHGDPHIDHEATAALARSALSLRPGLRFWSYPIWGRFAPTEDVAAHRVVRFESGPDRVAKTAAIACHRSQMTSMIDDDPQGFMMTAAMQAHFIQHPEVFLAD